MNRSVLVTGAGRRLGKEIAFHFAGQGFLVWLHFHHDQDEIDAVREKIAERGGMSEVVQADLRNPVEIQRMFQIVGQSSQLSMLINNASVFYKSRLNNLSVERWDEIFDVNLRAVWLCSIYAAEQMKKSEPGKGCIINISDSGAYQLWDEYGAYSLSRASVQTLSVLMAKTLAPSIRVNSISPGLILADGETDPETWEKLVRKTLVQHSGSPADLIEAVQYLAQSEYITGIDLPLDGGYRWKK